MDELDSGIVALAMQQLAGAGHNPTGILHADNLMNLAAQPGWFARLRLICRKVFLSRPELTMIYGQPARGWRWPLFHVLRMVQLVRRYLASLWALRVSEPALAEGVARRVRLAHWLDGPE